MLNSLDALEINSHKKQKALNNDDLLQMENCMQSQKAILEYQKDTAIPEDTLLKSTAMVIKFKTINVTSKRPAIRALESIN